MFTREVEVLNKLGLHTRAAAELVRTASKFESTVELKGKERTANAKGIMSVMMLAAAQGTTLELVTDGTDEVQASAAGC